MLGWAATFLIIALIAAALGFSGIAGSAVGIAKILFVVFLVLFLASLIFGRRRSI
jgi:uncharacterized membrane protein YtjA (UPF0391 family)